MADYFPIDTLNNHYIDAERLFILDLGDSLSKLCSPSKQLYNSERSFTDKYPRSLKGAQLLRILTGKLLRVLFPPDLDLVKVGLTADAKANIDNLRNETFSKGLAKVNSSDSDAFDSSNELQEYLSEVKSMGYDIDRVLAKINKRVREVLNHPNLKGPLSRGFEQGILYGNYLLRWLDDPKSKQPMLDLYTLDEFSVRTNRGGDVVELVVYDQVYLMTIPKDIRKKLEAGVNKNVFTNDDLTPTCHKLFYYSIDTGVVEEYYSLEFISDEDVKSSSSRKFLDKSKIGTLASTVKTGNTYNIKDFTYISGNTISRGNFGRPYFEDIKGALTYLDEMYSKLFNAMTDIANTQYILSPKVDTTELDFDAFKKGEAPLEAEPHEYAIYQSAHKAGEIATLFGSLNGYGQDIGVMFGQFNPEQKERTTAAYIQRYILEIEQLLGTIYTDLSEKLQREVFDRVFDYVKKDLKIDVSNVSNSIELKILSGAQLFSRQGKNLELQEAIPLLADVVQISQSYPYLKGYELTKKILENINYEDFIEDKALVDSILSASRSLEEEKQIEAGQDIEEERASEGQ